MAADLASGDWITTGAGCGTGRSRTGRIRRSWSRGFDGSRCIPAAAVTISAPAFARTLMPANRRLRFSPKSAPTVIVARVTSGATRAPAICASTTRPARIWPRPWRPIWRQAEVIRARALRQNARRAHRARRPRRLPPRGMQLPKLPRSRRPQQTAIPGCRTPRRLAGGETSARQRPGLARADAPKPGSVVEAKPAPQPAPVLEDFEE